MRSWLGAKLDAAAEDLRLCARTLKRGVAADAFTFLGDGRVGDSYFRGEHA